MPAKRTLYSFHFHWGNRPAEVAFDAFAKCNSDMCCAASLCESARPHTPEIHCQARQDFFIGHLLGTL